MTYLASSQIPRKCFGIIFKYFSVDGSNHLLDQGDGVQSQDSEQFYKKMFWLSPCSQQFFHRMRLESCSNGCLIHLLISCL